MTRPEPPCDHDLERRARVAPLRAAPTSVRAVSVEANAAVRATEMCWALCSEGRYGSAGELMADDFVHDDRRSGLTNSISGREATLENNRQVVELGLAPEFDTLAVRGDDLALVRARFRDAHDNEVVSLQVLATNDQGRRTCCVSFDDDDLAAARHEFDRLST